jgi:hypothetical protein
MGVWDCRYLKRQSLSKLVHKYLLTLYRTYRRTSVLRIEGCKLQIADRLVEEYRLWLSGGSESGSESYVTTDGQSASLSWNKAPTWGLQPDFYFITARQLRVCWYGGALSDERAGLSFRIAAGLVSAIILGAETRGTRDHILLSQILEFPFRRPLRLAGLRWRYSTPPPHGVFNLVSLELV